MTGPGASRIVGIAYAVDFPVRAPAMTRLTISHDRYSGRLPATVRPSSGPGVSPSSDLSRCAVLVTDRMLSRSRALPRPRWRAATSTGCRPRWDRWTRTATGTATRAAATSTAAAAATIPVVEGRGVVPRITAADRVNGFPGGPAPARTRSAAVASHMPHEPISARTPTAGISKTTSSLSPPVGRCGAAISPTVPWPTGPASGPARRTPGRRRR